MFVGEKLDLIDNDASKCCGGWVYASSLYSLSLIKLSKTDYTASCNCKVESNAFSFMLVFIIVRTIIFSFCSQLIAHIFIVLHYESHNDT